MGLALAQVALGIVLKIDQSPIALAHTLWGKKWRKSTLKAKDSHNVKSWHQQSQKTSSCFHIVCISTINVMLF